MDQGQARIIVGASEVAGDRRHTYLLFESSDGQQVVVRGGPDARSEGNDLVNFAESTVLGSEKFGNIIVDAAPYVAPYDAYLNRRADGSIVPVPVQGANPLLGPIEAGVNRIDVSLGREPDANSERMAISLSALAKNAGMTRVDHVLLSGDGTRTRAGENVFIVQGPLDDPAHLRAHMPTARAIATPIEESLHQVAEREQQRIARQDNARQLVQDQAIHVPAPHSMRI